MEWNIMFKYGIKQCSEDGAKSGMQMDGRSAEFEIGAVKTKGTYGAGVVGVVAVVVVMVIMGSRACDKNVNDVENVNGR